MEIGPNGAAKKGKQQQARETRIHTEISLLMWLMTGTPAPSLYVSSGMKPSSGWREMMTFVALHR
jgi:hypothetical protein